MAILMCDAISRKQCVIIKTSVEHVLLDVDEQHIKVNKSRIITV